MKKAVLAAALILCSTTVNAEYVNSDNGLNIRSEPNIQSEIVGVLGFGEEVTGRIKKGWMKIDSGYICADYLQDTNPLEDFEYLGNWRITAYAWTGHMCANERYPEEGYTIACNSLPLGSEVYIDGVGFRTVEDRGPAWMGDEWCDLYLGDTGECIAWGDQRKNVYLVNER